MRDILAPGSAGVLARLARSRTLLGFDFDGTLAPIVSRPEDATMRPQTARLFAAVCTLYPCAVVSGRSRADVLARLRGAPVKYVVGNHGLEPEPGGGAVSVAPEIIEARAALGRALREVAGVEVEDKGASLAVHYRRAETKSIAKSEILRAIGDLRRPVRLVPGKSALNLLPARGSNKGDAVLRLRGLERAQVALYVGDDVTDEDVFAIDQPAERLVSVRVGRSRSSAARYFISRQRDIDALLAALVRARERWQRTNEERPQPTARAARVAVRHAPR